MVLFSHQLPPKTEREDEDLFSGTGKNKKKNKGENSDSSVISKPITRYKIYCYVDVLLLVSNLHDQSGWLTILCVLVSIHLQILPSIALVSSKE